MRAETFITVCGLVEYFKHCYRSEFGASLAPKL